MRNTNIDPKLLGLLEMAAQHKMSAAEIWDQRVSFVYGHLMDCVPDITKEQVMAHAARAYGARPLDSSACDCDWCVWLGKTAE